MKTAKLTKLHQFGNKLRVEKGWKFRSCITEIDESFQLIVNVIPNFWMVTMK